MTHLLPGATWQRDLIERADRIATPTPTGRRVSFFSLVPHSGVSTVTTLAARLLTSRRPGRVLQVETGGTTGFLQPGVRRSGMTVPDTSEASGGLAQEVLDRLKYRAGTWMTDLPALAQHVALTPGGLPPGQRAGVREWYAHVAPMTRFFDVAATDWGTRSNTTECLEIVATGHHTCLISPFDRAVAEDSIAFAYHLRATTGQPVRVAFVDAAGTRSTWPGIVAPTLPFPAVVFAYDPGLSRTVKTTRLRASTINAVMTLAAALMAPDRSGKDAR
ncbi:hypothetical protein GCM10022198_23060 [Klugiella xanthotipulae]|uniref:MinD-like ATPase involved in chromosome partitioning or flagellar assembly n=1 Tax=Klugiella xanthotipulae TaxID=244735 RepID=A0A543I5T1_9MICO|nr:hypothetical protein [Klugiella xanthotipulae]TQM65966.1 hypothetical protein FB466_0786 [Klugiella xanthotipulae]